MAQTILGSNALRLPTGTNAERPSSPVAGQIRFNTESQKTEVYNGNQWLPLVVS